MKIYELAVHKPVLVTIGLVTLLAVGVISINKLPVEFLPQMDFPFIGILVSYPNSIPAHVEKQIARPLEEVFATLGGVREMFSDSSQDGCFVGVMFDWGRDVNVLRMEVKEKVDQIRGDLPADIERIQLFTFNSNDQPIMVGRISARGLDLMNSYDLLEQTIINPLKRIPGVGQVQIDGVEPQEISIYLEMDKIKAHRVDVNRLFSLIQTMNVNTTMGEVTANGLRYSMRGVGSFTTFEQVENLVISEQGLRLKDIATIHYGVPAPIYGRHLNGEPCVAFWVQKSSGANSVEVAARVNRQLEKINADPRLEGINVLLFWNQADQIVNSLNGLQQAGIVGALFAVFILYFFLRRVSTTLIVAMAIPFALLCTCAFLFFAGRSLNILTMMGLILGVGMLVDNAIVVIESIFRHQSMGEDSKKAAIIGSREVATAVVAATLTSIIVFAPVIVTQDASGMMTYLSQVGITISVALLFSLLISLTLIPFLTSRILKPKKVRSSKLIDGLQRSYERTLAWTTLKHPLLTGLVIVPLVLAITVGAAAMFKLDFDMEEGFLIERLFISYDLTDNLGYRQTEKYVNAVEAVLEQQREALSIKEVYSFYANNRAETTLYFETKYLSKKNLKNTRDKLRKVLPELAGVTFRFGDDEGQGSGAANRLEVTLFGEDIQLLDQYAQEAKRRLALLGGLDDVRTSIESGSEEIKIAINRDLAQQYGISPQTVSGIMNLTFRGMGLRRFQTEEREVPMDILLSPEDRLGLHNLKNLLVGFNEGVETTLGTVASLSVERGPTTIHRNDQRAAVSVGASFDKEKDKDMREKVASIMNTMQLPLGYSWSFSSRFEAQQEQKFDMLFNVLLALVCIYLVMAALFESLLHPLVIMSCLPFSLIGVIIALLVTHTAINMMVMIGVVILIGVVVNNGIVLVDHVNNFRREGYTIHEAIRRGGGERFRPIIMTASTTVLGLLPMAIGKTNVAGMQYYPLARAVMGGLAVATVLTLIALPTYYVLAERSALWWRTVRSRSAPQKQAKDAQHVSAVG